jgi:hypothetical protein
MFVLDTGTTRMVVAQNVAKPIYFEITGQSVPWKE